MVRNPLLVLAKVDSEHGLICPVQLATLWIQVTSFLLRKTESSPYLLFSAFCSSESSSRFWETSVLVYKSTESRQLLISFHDCHTISRGSPRITQNVADDLFNYTTQVTESKLLIAHKRAFRTSFKLEILWQKINTTKDESPILSLYELRKPWLINFREVFFEHGVVHSC